jgi:hypothetical protein
MTTWVEFLVEEPSMEVALWSLVPMIRPDLKDAFAVHPFEGRGDLLKKLPNRFKGYKASLAPESRIVVVLDEDRGDCAALKSRVESAARAAGLVPKGPGATAMQFQVLTRLAVEELEAWFFGDVPALVKSYAKVPPTLASRQAYRDPDAIAGGTWEALERVLQKAGHFSGGLPKVQVAREVSKHQCQ